MKLTILGSSASYAGPGQACSGYLVQDQIRSLGEGFSGEKQLNICIDLGNGSLSNLFRHIDPKDLDLLVITHAHMDHYADIFGLKQYLTYNGYQDRKVKLLAPSDLFAKLFGLSEVSEAGFKKAFEIIAIDEAEDETMLDIAGIVIALKLVSHYDLTAYAVSVTGSKKIVYSGDMSMRDGVDLFMRNADLLIAEATLRDSDLPNDGHLSGSQAGEIAKINEVKTLVLSHFWPAFDRRERLLEASQKYSGRIIEAKEGVIVDL